jgi:hypothetical protein
MIEIGMNGQAAKVSIYFNTFELKIRKNVNGHHQIWKVDPE